MKKIKENQIIFWSKDSVKTKSMTLSAMSLSFYTIFAFIGNTYFPLPIFGNFLNLDISLVFLIPLAFMCSVKWWFTSAFLSGFFNFLWAGAGGWIGAIFNVMVNVFTLFVFWGLKKLIIKNNKEKLLKIKIALVIFISTIICILFNCVINGILFTPLYWWSYQIGPASFIEMEKIYNSTESLHGYLLFIPKYWPAIFATYGSFNLLKFGLVGILLFPLIIIMYKSKIIYRYWK